MREEQRDAIDVRPVVIRLIPGLKTEQIVAEDSLPEFGGLETPVGVVERDT